MRRAFSFHVYFIGQIKKEKKDLKFALFPKCNRIKVLLSLALSLYVLMHPYKERYHGNEAAEMTWLWLICVREHYGALALLNRAVPGSVY